MPELGLPDLADGPDQTPRLEWLAALNATIRETTEMDDTAVMTPAFDRTAEDLGNIVELGHVNVRCPIRARQSHST